MFFLYYVPTQYYIKINKTINLYAFLNRLPRTIWIPLEYTYLLEISINFLINGIAYYTFEEQNLIHLLLADENFQNKNNKTKPKNTLTVIDDQVKRPQHLQSAPVEHDWRGHRSLYVKFVRFHIYGNDVRRRHGFKNTANNFQKPLISYDRNSRKSFQERQIEFTHWYISTTVFTPKDNLIIIHNKEEN